MKQSDIELLKLKHLQRSFWCARSQAVFRGQEWDLTEEEFIELWSKDDQFLLKGRGRDNLTMSRIDMDGAWTISNVHIVTRKDMLREEANYKRGK